MASLNMDWWFNTKTGDFFAESGSNSLESLPSSSFQDWVDLGIPSTDSLAQAQAVAAKKYPGSPAGQNLTSQGTSTPPSGNASVSPLTRFTDIATALSAFYAKVTDGKMWRSVGWLLLGVVLIIFGLVLWIGPGAVKASPYGRAFSAIRGAG